MSPKKKVPHSSSGVDPKKIDKVRKSLNKSIDGFKQTVLGKTAAGPLQASLGPDIMKSSEVQEEPESIMVVKPMIDEQTGIVPMGDVEQWVTENITENKPVPELNTDDAPYADVSIKPAVLPPVPSVIDEAPYADVSIKPPQFAWRSVNVQVFFAGMDNQISSGVRAFLQKMGAATFLPQDRGHGRHSIIEQFAMNPNFNFAVVVLSADELMFQKIQDPKNALLVTKQETVFELGFLVGKLGRNRVAVFYEDVEKFKRPTEYFDVLYTPYDSVGQWQEKLLRQMKTAGLSLKEEEIAGVK